ncbi:MAG: hypothetical protein ABH986_04975 [archaeon]
MKESFGVKESVMQKLSPLQKKIVSELSFGPKTLPELSEKTNSSVYTIGKQLSMLQGRTKCNCLQKKGINEPIVKKIKEEKIKTTYFLALR